MEYEVDYLKKFLQAMKEWEVPDNDDNEKRKRVENQIKDTLVSERAVKQYRLRIGMMTISDKE